MRTLREIWRFAISNKPSIKRKQTKRAKTPKRVWRKVSDNEKKTINELRKKGMTLTQIGQNIGRSQSVVSKVLSTSKKYTVNQHPSNPKAVYQRHQDRIASGRMEYIPNHHLCPVCNPNSKTTWREYFTMTHKATVENARKARHSSQWTLSNY